MKIKAFDASAKSAEEGLCHIIDCTVTGSYTVATIITAQGILKKINIIKGNELVIFDKEYDRSTFDDNDLENAQRIHILNSLQSDLEEPDPKTEDIMKKYISKISHKMQQEEDNNFFNVIKQLNSKTNLNI